MGALSVSIKALQKKDVWDLNSQPWWMNHHGNRLPVKVKVVTWQLLLTSEHMVTVAQWKMASPDGIHSEVEESVWACYWWRVTFSAEYLQQVANEDGSVTFNLDVTQQQTEMAVERGATRILSKWLKVTELLPNIELHIDLPHRFVSQVYSQEDMKTPTSTIDNISVQYPLYISDLT